MSRPKSASPGLGRHKRVTLQDIADAAGVHIMTVSNALGNTRSVAPDTKERVLRIARELNYIPNLAARALVAGRTGMIAVVSGALSEPYYANMVHLLEECMEVDGYRLTLLHRPHDVLDLLNQTGSVAVDGAIGIDMYHWMEKFHSHPAIPCVAIGTHQHELMDYVVVDLSSAVTEALERMAAAGRQRIAYLVDAPHLGDGSEVRSRAYLDFIQRTGREAEIINIYTDEIPAKNNFPFRKKLAAYFDAKGCPDGLFCLNDEIAMYTYRVLRDLGRSIPDDVLLVGCDGQTHMEYFDPPLSTIAQPMEEMCALAWQFLQQRMADRALPLQQQVLEGELLVRESLGTMPNGEA